MTGTRPSPADPQTRPQPVDNPDRWRSRPNPHLHIGPTARPCPTCGAPVGEPCLDRRGAEQDGFHRTRSARAQAPRPPAPSRPTATPARGPAMSEAELGREVAKLAKRGGWRSNHHRRSRRPDGGWETATSVAGWPDLVLWKPGPGGGVLFRELKATRGVLSDKQEALLDELRRSGADAKCWWPAALHSGEIERTLCGHLTDG